MNLSSPDLLYARAPRWAGRASAQHLVVFGASWSCPSFAGAPTWTAVLAAALRIPPQNVRNFAAPGASAMRDLRGQLAAFAAGSAPPPESTLYVLAFGINDCAFHDEEQLPPLVAKLSDAARTLVDSAGAQSFLLLDVPPLERSPGCERLGPFARSAGPRYAAWNALLLGGAPTLAPEADVLVFSAARVVRDMLDDPRACGLWAREDAWSDRIHLSARGHEVLAGRVLDAIFVE